MSDVISLATHNKPADGGSLCPLCKPDLPFQKKKAQNRRILSKCFLKILFILKAESERQEIKKAGFHSPSILQKWPQQPRLGQAETRSQEFFQACHAGVRGPSA